MVSVHLEPGAYRYHESHLRPVHQFCIYIFVNDLFQDVLSLAIVDLVLIGKFGRPFNDVLIEKRFLPARLTLIVACLLCAGYHLPCKFGNPAPWHRRGIEILFVQFFPAVIGTIDSTGFRKKLISFLIRIIHGCGHGTDSLEKRSFIRDFSFSNLLFENVIIPDDR